MIQRGPAVFLLLWICLAPAPASSEEWLSGGDLEHSCDVLLGDAASAEGLLCLAFVQGFIAGADTSVSAAGPRGAVSSSGKETYAGRAARTRLGTLRLQQIQSTYGRYCIGNQVTAVEVVEQVTDYLESHPEASNVTAHDAVREALVYSFPCET
ncbi:MAG TPA: Rap1a/Tai family immunity protein [Woeseiaceae bacterium]|nr:Rap1a/Tai family immunity protein [Woeseiaceae bacterium]